MLKYFRLQAWNAATKGGDMMSDENWKCIDAKQLTIAVVAWKAANGLLD